ncbi:MaoC family dehydratase [Planosporangium flavigriseum]|uniref:(R)-specific enoyl-CoA hydratase n=1 Tax=Planosporangium flavigriseum TaxID=373681 RepID=A0A8J3LXG4_9ACTN|nr:MaoC family dehydratase [Planosporangium flavigriseum]NJC67471.1 MaoC family dehydratase [Planosporangium flavigriseum]GIG75579.1 (R)-specific enoyl-CoA hydratase [Planosporangium flavigriseum]
MIYKTFEEIKVGDRSVWTRTVTESDVVIYAGLIGDRGPLHLDDEFASKTRFGARLTYGMLNAGYIGATLAQLLGTGSAYVAQNLRFTAPVRIGDNVLVETEVTAKDEEKRRVFVRTTVSRGDGVLAIEGEAELFIFRVENPAV